MANVRITTTSLPIGVTGVAYSQTVLETGGVAPVVWSVSAGTLPTGLSLDDETGVLSGTPSVASTFTFTIQVEDDDGDTDTQAFTMKVYAPLAITTTDEGIEGGSQLQFDATGGSGNYEWSVTNGNLINSSTGLFTALNGGTAIVTVYDIESGQIDTHEIAVTSQNQFCVTGEVIEDATVAEDVCCEYNVECGEKLQLRVPSFHVVENGLKMPVQYSGLTQVTTGEASAIRSTSEDAGAVGNPVSFLRDAFFEIVTSYDMAQTDAGEIGIGWSSPDVDSTIGTIEHAVVWYTDGSDRKIEIRHNGTPEDDSQFDIAQGDVVSFGVMGGVGVLKINSIKVFTSDADFTTCGDAVLDIGIENPNKTVGGYVTNLSWSVLTMGLTSDVGSIDADGVYTSPSNPIAGIVKIVGALNNANFFLNIRNIQPTPRFTKPNSFLAGRKVSVWVTNRKATDNDIMRIASDGSPDAIQNPGMIDLGTLEASATFAEDIAYQDYENDEGIYFQSIASEKATLTGNFLEVRDLEKLAVMMQHATLYPKVKGVTELGVGGKTCGGCDLRVVLVVEAGSCGSGWDVLYMPRVNNAGNLSLEIGRKVASKYALNFRVLPDATRPRGKQLYSIYQISNCSGDASGNSCE